MTLINPEELTRTFSTSVGLANEDDKTPDTTPQKTLMTMVSSEKKNIESHQPLGALCPEQRTGQSTELKEVLHQ